MREDLIKIAAVGDICFADHFLCLGFGVRSTIEKEGPDFIFEHVRDILLQSDIIFGNLEGVLSDHNVSENALGSRVFRGSPTAMDCLVSAGFNMVNMANNHTAQHGIVPFMETVNGLEKRDISVFGLNGKDSFSSIPVIKTIRGIRIGFLGYAFQAEGCASENLPYSVGNAEKIEIDVKRLKNEVDYVIVSCHWGVELMNRPSPLTVHLAHRIVEAGADVIFGHHSHTFQPVERYGSGLIFYSLGNFVFDAIWSDFCRKSAIVTLRLGMNGDIDYELNPVRITRRLQPVSMSSAEAMEFRNSILEHAREMGEPETLDQLEKASLEYYGEVHKVNRLSTRHKVIFLLLNLYRLRMDTLLALGKKVLGRPPY